MESVPCPACANPASSVLFEGRDVLHGGPGVFPVRRCTGCGLIYVSPRPAPDEIAAYYPAGYGPHAVPGDPATPDRGRRRNILQAVRWIESAALVRGRALDVGCGAGGILEELRSRGWSVCGVEPAPAAAATARDRLGLDVRPGLLQTAGFERDDFDLVCFWHSLEHVPDPRDTLIEAARVTKPGGTLVLSLPNPENWMARWFGPDWCGWDVPRHLCLFPRRTLARLLEETGWEAPRIRARGGRFWYISMSLENRARSRGRSSAAHRRMLRVLTSRAAQALTLPLFILFERLDRSPNLLVTARRAPSSPPITPTTPESP